MAEIYTVIDQRPLSFEGYFRSDELFQIIRRFVKERGYFPLETKNYEEVYPHGRQVNIELKPFKKISDYVKLTLKLRIKFTHLQEEMITIDGHKHKYMKGKVSLVSDALIFSDYQAKWEGAGWLYFLRTINDKFIRKDWMSQAKADVGKDLEDLYSEISSYLNMIRFKVEQPK